MNDLIALGKAYVDSMTSVCTELEVDRARRPDHVGNHSPEEALEVHRFHSIRVAAWPVK